ncbi:MAG: NF038143 family protein [Desulfobacterales bacterium]|jgi:hypothetical protein
MKKYDIIEAAERQFAREVTLGIIVTRPLTAWHYLIPGFFIIDFLRRGSAIRRFTKQYMYPRKLAMDSAEVQMRSGNLKIIQPELEDNLRHWLESQRFYFPDLVQAYVVLVDVLKAHYLKLLEAEGDTFYLLIAHAYQHRHNFKDVVEAISTAESEVDRLVIKQLGADENLKEKIIAEHQQIAKRRQKILEEVF